MRIQPLNNSYNINQYNKKTNTKYLSAPIDSNNYIAERSLTNNQQVNFAGLFGLFSSPKEENISFDADIGVLSQKQINKTKKLVNQEIYNIIYKSDYSEANSKRLDKLLHSAFVDYKLEGFLPERSFVSLNDLLLVRNSENNNRLYNQFLITSLTETLPELTFHDIPDVELSSSDYTLKYGLKKIYHNNNAIFQILQSYLKMDEDSKEAENIRKMIKNLKEYNMETNDYPSFFAECLLNNKTKMCKFLCDEFGFEPITVAPAVRNSHDRDNISRYKDKKGVSPIYDDIQYYGNEQYPNFAIIYPDKTRDIYISSDDCHNYELYDISALSHGKEAKEFFDIPEYLYQSFKGKTSLNYFAQDTDMWGYPEGIYQIQKFFWNNRSRHPELSTIDFLEKFISKFTTEELRSGRQANGIDWGNWDRNDNIKQVLSLIKQLQNDNSPEAQKRFDILKLMYMNIGNCADIPRNKLNENLEIIKYLDVDDIDLSKDEINEKLNGKLNNYISNKYDIYDIKSWNNIIDEFSQNPDFLKYFVLNNLPDLFYTEENRSEYRKVVEKIKTIDGNWNITDRFGNNLAHRAVESENPLLIEFAKEKNIDFKRKNNAGKTAVDLIYDNRNNPALNLVKVNSEELLNFAEKGLQSAIEILLTNPAVDINSINKNGDNAGIIAASRGDAGLIRFLNKNENFDINYVNPKTLRSAYTSAKNNEVLKAIMENPNLNKSKSDLSNYNELFNLLDNPDNSIEDIEKLLNKLSKNKDFNLGIIYNGKSLQEKIKEYAFKKDINNKDQIHERLYSNLQQNINNSFLNRTRNIIDKNGILTCKQIQDFINYPKAKNIINEPLNELNEAIGFFIADIPVDGSNITDIINLIEKLKEFDYKFSATNKTGQTLLEKSIDSENKFLTEYLLSIGVRK